MKILVTGNTGYIGPVLGGRIKAGNNNIKLVGYDTGFFLHCLTAVDRSPDLNYDIQYYGDIRKFDKTILKGVDVVILYPSGKVSDIQEKQWTTLGQNITALEVDGVFDDCQDMVKTAFLDNEINPILTSANSINVARWLPQMFYFFFAYKQVYKQDANT